MKKKKTQSPKPTSLAVRLKITAVPAPPNLSTQQRYEEMLHLKTMVNFRIRNQSNLLAKIALGKWKTQRVPKEVLYSLAKLDLKLLNRSLAEIDQALLKLKSKAAKEQ